MGEGGQKRVVRLSQMEKSSEEMYPTGTADLAKESGSMAGDVEEGPVEGNSSDNFEGGAGLVVGGSMVGYD